MHLKKCASRTMRWGALFVVLLSLTTSPAFASIETWVLTGTLNGNTVSAGVPIETGPGPCTTVSADWRAGLTNGAATTANLTSAGVVAGAPFSMTVSFDTDQPDYLQDGLGLPVNPDAAIYSTAAINWTVGNLTARTHMQFQSTSYNRNVDISVPPATPTFLDLLIISGGDPAAHNAATYNLEMVFLPGEGTLGAYPAVALAYLPSTLPTTPPPPQILDPNAFFILDKGLAIPLIDSDTGECIQLSGNVTTIAVSQPAPSCVGLGGDTDGDTICDDVDVCPSIFDIDQADSDLDGIGDNCNSAIDADGDDWSDTEDNCVNTPNGGRSGSCRIAVPGLLGEPCFTHEDCSVNPAYSQPEACSRLNEDTDDDGVGDVCDPDWIPVPEPGQLALFAAGLTGLMGLARRKSRR